MLKHFIEILRDMVCDRTIEVETEVLSKDKYYRELDDKIIEVLDRIELSLPPAQQKLMFDLDELSVEQDVLAYKIMYKQGVLDGLKSHRILRWLKAACQK
jgi:hypothetical protein